MASYIERRKFLATLGGAAASWPLAARAQQQAMPVIGFLGSAAAEPFAGYLAVFRQSLGESGYVEGRNVAIEYRWAENQYDRLPALAADLVRRRVAVIIASGGPAPAMAAKAATSTIPIVFTASNDPVRLGLVASLNRPGGNVTGTSALTVELDAKRLAILRELVPTAGVIGALVNPNRPGAEIQSSGVQEAARGLGQQVSILNAGSERDIDVVFATLVRERIGALLVSADPFFNSARARLVALAARHGVATIFNTRDFPAAGGLASYGADIADGYRQAGIYAGRILKGDKPGDLPVVQPTKFELVINLKTAKALDLTIPPSLLALADEVIE